MPITPPGPEPAGSGRLQGIQAQSLHAAAGDEQDGETGQGQTMKGLRSLMELPSSRRYPHTTA